MRGHRGRWPRVVSPSALASVTVTSHPGRGTNYASPSSGTESKGTVKTDPGIRHSGASSQWFGRSWHASPTRVGPRTRRARAVIVAVACMVGAACSGTDDADAAQEQELAEQLVLETQQAGVAPRLTVDVAESLYGTDAPAVCAAFEGGTTTVGDLVSRGNLAHGRRKTITDDAVTYTGLVIKTYCPEVMGDFADAVGDLDLFEVSGR